jgi:hypothetical protein
MESACAYCHFGSAPTRNLKAVELAGSLRRAFGRCLVSTSALPLGHADAYQRAICRLVLGTYLCGEGRRLKAEVGGEEAGIAECERISPDFCCGERRAGVGN